MTAEERAKTLLTGFGSLLREPSLGFAEGLAGAIASEIRTAEIEAGHRAYRLGQEEMREEAARIVGGGAIGMSLAVAIRALPVKQ